MIPHPISPTKEWDYTAQAKYYSFRPNYAPSAIEKLIFHVKAKESPDYIVADVGAGTGNLTLMLLERGLRCIAIEPNEAMRQIGIERTQSMKVEWRVGTGESTMLLNSSIDWFTMGSSFNTTDRLLTLQEAHRVLKTNGYFTCMWNHRDLENDPVQQKVEEIIRSVIPEYEHGVRREGQADFILGSGFFNDVYYIEEKQVVTKSLREYIDAWKSVRNKFWDIETKQGFSVFAKIAEKIEDEFASQKSLSITYITRIWNAKMV